ncbi:carbon storage regulator [Adhaeretor mobilis]|uniref:Translational regulator CsrA n=1 Tax=Adhaeretor mobilis TaxID=1930276 RepID=A0A517MRT6_9BACT|nr:carbon storage regulator [Adhaeretor mobilis]QDS97593.1 hypothetical protein HG15A2_08560 [Adhaeretor mobilis]
MLVLSRKESQRIRLGDDIVITVVRLAGDKVRLGIDAPREMLVLRDELEPLEPPISKQLTQAAATLPATVMPATGLPQTGFTQIDASCGSVCCVTSN